MNTELTQIDDKIKQKSEYDLPVDHIGTIEKSLTTISKIIGSDYFAENTRRSMSAGLELRYTITIKNHKNGYTVSLSQKEGLPSKTIINLIKVK